MEPVADAVTMSLLPPAISDMGTSSGFTLYLEDRAGKGRSQCQWSDSVMLTCLSKQHGAVGRINPLVKRVNILR